VGGDGKVVDSRTLTRSNYDPSEEDDKITSAGLVALQEEASSLFSSFDSSLDEEIALGLNDVVQDTIIVSPSTNTTTTTPKATKSKRRAVSLLLRHLSEEVDVEAYMAKREMTAQQERWNAWTMLPPLVFALYYTLAGLWIPSTLVQALRQELLQSSTTFSSSSSWPWEGDPSQCWSQSTADTATIGFWPAAMPPWTIWAIVVGTAIHVPWSFLYHYHYATTLPPGVARTHHWSRRMDHAVMHITAALFTYATSARIDYFLVTFLFNIDCALRHWEPRVRPRRNKVRISLAILAYALPLLKVDVDLWIRFWFAMGGGMWLFACYPLGGWSHAAFHLALVPALHPLLQAAAWHSASQVQFGAQCAAMVQ
jgi:hypothetical protein